MNDVKPNLFNQCIHGKWDKMCSFCWKRDQKVDEMYSDFVRQRLAEIKEEKLN